MVGEAVYEAEHVVLATGSDPVIPPVPGLRELDGVWTNREVTGLTEVPRRLLVLGGGPVGVELAQALARMGASWRSSRVREHVLPREPAALGTALGEALEADGIALHFGRHAAAARREGDEYVLEFADGDELRGDRLLVATGRRPRVEGIGLESVGLDAIRVDARMRVADGLWAIGDVTGVWPLTYVGKYQGRIAAANILGAPREADYRAVPRVVFSDPQAAAVGEAEGRFSVDRAAGRGAADGHLHARLRRGPGFLTLVSDGERLTGPTRSGRRPASGSSRPRWRSGRACRWSCSTT